MESFDWHDFPALGAHELHAILRLRGDVFVVEQACAFADIDGNDPQARHLLAYVGPDFAGCLRLFPPGALGPAAWIGRVVVAPPWRGIGLGRRLMLAGLAESERLYGAVAVDISAQARLERFYASLGFERMGPDYVEDGILHCWMRCPR
jgi:ElaA protein